MFKTRLELIAYVISDITDTKIEDCYKEALKYENVPFKVRWTCD